LATARMAKFPIIITLVTARNEKFPK